MKVTDKFVMFFRRSRLGNWVKVPGGISVSIGEETIKLPTSEHVFMALKAYYFGDLDILERIKSTESPKEAKRLGRLVSGFSEESWEKVRENAMWQAIKLRYAFDPSFREELGKPEYEGKEFVECNPYDFIWSCGWGEDDPNALDPTKWRGLNLLGKLLTKLRRDERNNSF